jgi:hypothetical protein
MEGIVVFKIDGDPHPIGGQPPLMDKEIPCHLGGLFLEIVTKGEIPQHLEKSMVPGGLPYDLQVIMFPSGPDTLL